MIRTYFRRKRQFLGIRSHPSFVKAITVAFETSAASLEGLLRSGAGEGKDRYIEKNGKVLKYYFQSLIVQRNSYTIAQLAHS